MNNKGRVLIVDDEINAIKVLSAIISDAGYKVITALNAEKAIKIIPQKDIDVVITDLKIWLLS